MPHFLNMLLNIYIHWDAPDLPWLHIGLALLWYFSLAGLVAHELHREELKREIRIFQKITPMLKQLTGLLRAGLFCAQATVTTNGMQSPCRMHLSLLLILLTPSWLVSGPTLSRLGQVFF